ncbi:cupin domain-containing protein [Caenimonas sedimenti]|uniref:Cupin domain-containing protein n=1 Tax=Caenimonas sedimenti TaxID=2596921 RepID=A0A562ZXU5_9BURK|nr:cupin domain-containing protein [Caenimonas sedimenti]TWO73201.1 cupin domain-containing protein [Caenimonas sedimenti]
MDTTRPLPLLGGLSPDHFMRRHWQKKPLLVRQAVPGLQPLLTRQALFALAARDDVESRLVAREGRSWRLRRGPFGRRALPPVSRPDWTLLVQGVDLHEPTAHTLLRAFDFIPAVRLDDLMISWASDGGGVGPHFDSYDVFLLQAQGRRRWRIGRQRDLTLRDDVPLKVLANFEPEQEYVLEPGDMLYLPPRYAHDGTAVGECQTYSIGFRAPARGELARELLQRIADEAGELGDQLYRDAGQEATAAPGELPPALRAFAQDALAAALKDPRALDRALGEYLTEPKPDVWFEAGQARRGGGVTLDARTRMLYDQAHVFVNGDSWRAGGRDARLLQRLADRRKLEAAELRGASEGAQELLAQWCEAGWAHAEGEKR